MMKRLLAALFFCLLLPGLAGAETVLRRGNGAEPETLDPHQATGLPEAMIFYDIYEGLLSRGPDGKPQPAIADRWETSADGLQVTFHLRDGAKWSDGSPITAGDVVFSFRRLANPATSRNNNFVWPIKNARALTNGTLSDTAALGVAALDAQNVRFTLEEPTPYFISLLSYPMLVILPESRVTALGREFFKPGNLVSSGGYRLAEQVPQGHVKLERNPFHRDAAKAAFDTVYFYPTENQETELKRFRAGELDTTYTLPPAQIPWAKANLPDALRLSPQLGTYFLTFNLEKEPWKSKPDLRRALSMVIDREVLTERISQGGEMPSLTFVPPTVTGYQPARPEWADWPMERRVAVAQMLLSKAGYPGGQGLTLDILFNTADNHRRIAVAVAGMVQQRLGVKSTLTNQEWKVFLDTRRTHNFTGLARHGIIGAYDDPNAFLQFLRTDMGPENPAAYSHPVYDRLMAASVLERDPAKRLEILYQAEALAAADAPIIPLFTYARVRLVSPRLAGWLPNPFDCNPSRFLSPVVAR